MRRDKENHKLKLDRLDELPSIVMKQVALRGCALVPCGINALRLLP